MTEPNPTRVSGRAEKAKAEQAERLAEIRADEEDRLFLWQMGTEEGRHYQWCLLRDSGFGAQESFSTNNADMANRVGKQDVGRMIYLRAHRLCPQQWALMWQEARRREQDRNVNDDQ